MFMRRVDLIIKMVETNICRSVNLCTHSNYFLDWDTFFIVKHVLFFDKQGECMLCVHSNPIFFMAFL